VTEFRNGKLLLQRNLDGGEKKVPRRGPHRGKSSGIGFKSPFFPFEKDKTRKKKTYKKP